MSSYETSTAHVSWCIKLHEVLHKTNFYALWVATTSAASGTTNVVGTTPLIDNFWAQYPTTSSVSNVED